MSQRLPVLLWGDIVKDGAPVLRRALAGTDAHDCMYAWVYLTDFLANRRLAKALVAGRLKPDFRLSALDSELWGRLDRAEIDPHYQINSESFRLVSTATAATHAMRSAPTIVELGSTFYASRVKHQVVEAFAGKATKPTWVGIDNSKLMQDTTDLLHDDAVKVLNHTSLHRGGPGHVLLSRFVASYVFTSAAEHVDFIASNFDAAVIEDPYATIDADISVENHGQPETFLSLPRVFSGLVKAGYRLHVLDSYPDCPTGSARCHVTKYVAVRKQAVDLALMAGVLDRLGYNLPASADPSTVLATLNAAISEAYWAKVQAMKEISPVWGPTSPDAALPTSGDGAEVLGPWRNYVLSGRQAVDQISRAISTIEPKIHAA